MSEEIKEMLWKIKRQNTYDDIGYFKTPLSNDDADKLLNYITNLQKENKNLLYEINGYLKEKEELKEKINKLEDYKQRNEKAVEYIKEWWYEKNTRDINRIVSLGDKRIDLLNILEGGDE